MGSRDDPDACETWPMDLSAHRHVAQKSDISVSCNASDVVSDATREVMAKTLFERLGGFGKVSKVVLEFYDRVLSNETLAKYFVGVDMKRQVDHQTKFFSYLMGGPASFTDEHLINVHKRLHISPEAFDEMALTLRETLEDFELDESDIAAVMSAFLSRRRLVMEAEAS